MELSILEKKKENTKLVNAKDLSGNEVQQELASLEIEEKKKLEQIKVAEAATTKYSNEVYKPAYKAYGAVNRILHRWMRVYETGQLPVEGATDEKKERREFIMRCPADGCRGYLSTG